MFPTTKNNVVMLPGFLSGFRKYWYLGNVTLSRCFLKTTKTRLFVGVSCQMFTFVLKLVQRSNIRLTLLPILARQTVFWIYLCHTIAQFFQILQNKILDLEIAPKKFHVHILNLKKCLR